MAFGMPVITAFAGGVGDYVENNRNGLVYRCEETEVLSQMIINLFNDNQLATRLSDNARATIQEKFLINNDGRVLVDIYQKIIYTSVAEQNLHI